MVKARFSSDALQDQLRQRQLDVDNQKRYAPSSSKVYHEPTLTAPTPPSGFAGAFAPSANRLRAYYIRQDDKFDMWFSLLCGSGFNSGVGEWTMSVPFPIPSSNTTLIYAAIGTWHARDANTGNVANGTIWVATSTTVKFVYPAAAPIGAETSVGGSAPWLWANNDRFGGHITFPIN